jgi:hypothetical protein
MISQKARALYDQQAKGRQVRKPADSVKEKFPEQKGQSRDQAGERQATSTGGKKPQLVKTLPQAAKAKSRDQAGALTGVSGIYVDRARRVIERGDSEPALYDTTVV